MPKTLVIQSHNPARAGAWLATCTASVRAWCALHSYDYQFYGDEAFADVPDWYIRKAGKKLPVVADLARLLLIGRAIESGYERACWLDADTLVLDASMLNIDRSATCSFGREFWVQRDGRRRLRVHRNVHNAICVFQQNCPVLPFLTHTTRQIIQRVDPQHLAPQMVGPKLLSALHNLVGFDLLNEVGALSPVVLDDLLAGGGPALDRMRAAHGGHLAALNLSASVNGAEQISRLANASGLSKLLNDG